MATLIKVNISKSCTGEKIMFPMLCEVSNLSCRSYEYMKLYLPCLTRRNISENQNRTAPCCHRLQLPNLHGNVDCHVIVTDA